MAMACPNHPQHAPETPHLEDGAAPREAGRPGPGEQHGRVVDGGCKVDPEHRVDQAGPRRRAHNLQAVGVVCTGSEEEGESGDGGAGAWVEEQRRGAIGGTPDPDPGRLDSTLQMCGGDYCVWGGGQ